MAGESAVMAVTPQMEVPAAIRELILGGRPILLPNQGINVIPTPIEAQTAGRPTNPTETKSTALSFAPTHTIPACRIAFEANLIPGSRAAGSGIVFLIASPSMIDTGIPDIGDAAPSMPCIASKPWPRYSAPVNPPSITSAEAAIPGNNSLTVVRLDLASLICAPPAAAEVFPGLAWGSSFFALSSALAVDSHRAECDRCQRLPLRCREACGCTKGRLRCASRFRRRRPDMAFVSLLLRRPTQ
mmetsp:Transcript_14357/g.25724  ORF Transcript_14357/g.25724 Transcript_14357/m.25724 type:complete len:243 (+) Transcript_14357:831-1559(+)